MADRIAQVLADQIEAICANASARLTGRAEFAGDQRHLAAALSTLAAALIDAARDDQPERLSDAALALGRDDGDPCRGYGRVQLLLDVLCSESVEALRRVVLGSEGKEASARLRGLLGPAMLGLADLCRQTDQAGPPEAGAERGS
ncbi:MAG: hypothetical protein HZB16_06390 [Armatimonadetes bacterium]|nr:hypothetical protein [Armatimonadota bacterium]